MVGAVWLSALFGLACGQQEANLPASGNQEPKGEASVLSAYEESQVHMATLVRLRFYAAGDAAARTASEAVFGRIKVLNEILSDYSETSELSRLCQTAGTGPTKAGPELYRVLDRSLYWFRESEGRFDVTLAPLIRQWRRARKTKKMPTAEQIAALRPLCGSENMTLDPGTRTVTLAKKGMLLDLGGIAKGYVGDECGRTFHKHGVTRYLIAIGGDLVIGGPPPEKPEWWAVRMERSRYGRLAAGCRRRAMRPNRR